MRFVVYRRCHLVFVFCGPTDRYLGDGDADRHEILHDGRGMSQTMFLDVFGGYQMRDQEGSSGGPFWPLRHRILPFDIENGKSQSYMSIRT